MNPDEKEKVSTVRWHVANKWGDSASQKAVLELCGGLLGYGPGDSKPSSPAVTPKGSLPRVAVVVGHNSKATGADAPDPIGDEFGFNNLVADKMVELASEYGIEAKRFNRSYTGSYSGEIRSAYAAVDNWNPVASIELHFNDSAPEANGTETLHSGSPKSKALAKCVQDAMLSSLGLRDRGLKEMAKTDRGGLSVHAGKAPGILVEPFFCHNSKDFKSAVSLGIDGFARMYLSGLAKYAK
jgi:N-acetylmuramoyl-L-alanine amidase